MIVNQAEVKRIIELAKEKNKNDVFFGRDADANNIGLMYVHLTIDKQRILFTTSSPEYTKIKDLEGCFERLFKEFGIDLFQTSIHHHTGLLHDKDVAFLIKDSNVIPAILVYIIRNFYNSEQIEYLFK